MLLAFICTVALAVLMFFDNLPDLCYNLFHKNKRAIYWNPIIKTHMRGRIDSKGKIDLDFTERFWHD